MATPDQQILELDALLNQNVQQGIVQVTNLISMPNGLSYVPIIFNLAKNQYLVSAAIKILDNHIKTNWAALSQSDREEFRGFVTTSISNCPDNPGIKSQLYEVLVQIAIRSYPEEWPGYIDDVIDSLEFIQFSYFLDALESSPINILPSQRKAAIIQSLVANSQSISQALISNYQISDDALRKFIKYLKWDVLSKVNTNCIIFTQDPLAFGPLCSVLLIDELPEDFIHASFNTISQLEVTDASLFVRVVPVLQKYLSILEQEQYFPALNNVHMKLLEIDFMELLHYWEPFVVTIFAQFQKSGGIAPRFNLHFQVLSKIREYVIFHMIQPPNFIIPEVTPPTNDQSQRDNYNDMRSIILSFITMTPKEVLEAFQTGLQFLRTNYDENGFLSIIWALGCISGATNSQLESIFVVESMKFVLEIFKKPNINKPVVASSFLFLASAYARAQKLTPQFIDVTITLAIQALDSVKTQKIAANALLSITKHGSSLISRIPPGLIEIIGGAPIPADTFCIICEAAARLYLHKGKIDPIVQILVNRWNVVSSANELNFDVVREQQIIMNGFVGIARVSKEAMEKIVVKFRQLLINITGVFGKNLLDLYTENGYDAIHREDFRFMSGFIQAEIILFTELGFKDCGDVLTMYSEMPDDLKIPESLSLTEALFKSEIEPKIVQGLHETVIKPTIEMITSSPGEYPAFSELLPRVMNALSQSYFEATDSDDIQYLLNALLENNHVTVLNAIKALDTCVEKADLKLIDEPRNAFFRTFLGPIVYRLMVLLTDQSRSYCYAPSMRLLYKLYDFIGTGKLRCQLFPDVENVPGMAAYIATMTVQDFPLVTVPEIAALAGYLFQKMPIEKFEELLAQYVARVRQTTPGETLNYLRLQSFKDSFADFIYT